MRCWRASAPSASFDDLRGADLVVEAVFEDRKIKAEVTRQAEAVLEAGAIFASNTSTLPITGLAEASVRPENFIGLHFFSPVERMPLVEIIRGRRTSDAVSGARHGLRPAHRQDADHRQRQPRLLYQPGLRHLCQRGPDAARRRRRLRR